MARSTRRADEVAAGYKLTPPSGSTYPKVTCELLLYLVLAKFVLLLESAPHVNDIQLCILLSPPLVRTSVRMLLNTSKRAALLAVGAEHDGLLRTIVCHPIAAVLIAASSTAR